MGATAMRSLQEKRGREMSPRGGSNGRRRGAQRVLPGWRRLRQEEMARRRWGGRAPMVAVLGGGGGPARTERHERQRGERRRKSARRREREAAAGLTGAPTSGEDEAGDPRAQVIRAA